MLLFLCKTEQTNQLTDYIKTDFDGHNLRTYLDGRLIDLRPAKVGECYSFYTKGFREVPVIKKKILPTGRGNQIAWALSFNKKKITHDYRDFLMKFETYNSQKNGCLNLASAPNRYGLIIERKPNGKAKPLLIFLEDDLTQDELHSLVRTYQIFKKLYCPEEFILKL